MRLLYGAAAIWAFLGVITWISKSGELSSNLIPLLAMSALWFGPLWLIHRRAGKLREESKAYVGEFLTALGHTDERLFHLSRFAGSIGLNPDAKRLVLSDGRVVKTDGFEDVREWVTEEKSAAPAAIIGGGALAVGALASNLGAANVARARSGLIVRVRDADRPEWLITMDRPTRARWFELLTQAINEGGLKAA